MKATLFSLVGLMLLTSSVSARVDSDVTKGQLQKLAFDPALYFAGYDPLFGPLFTAIYRGDDYQVPVFSLAVAEICQKPSCELQERDIFVRIVRSPKQQDADRPRAAGFALLSRLEKQGATSKKALLSALDGGEVEWLEASLKSCPGAGKALERIRSADWTVDADDSLFNLNNEKGHSDIVLHFDTMLIAFRNSYTQKISYDGLIKDYAKIADVPDFDDPLHVTAETLRFMKLIEPCLMKSQAAPPWHRKIKLVD
jgi:hypothetical protein